MRKVKVYNDNKNVSVWTEQFKGETVSIPYGQPIEMEFYEAHEFKGQFYPPKVLGDETQDPKSFKMIRVERPSQEELEKDTKAFGYKCNACKKSYQTIALLTKHSEIEHEEQIITDPGAEAEAQEKRKRGRPAKSQEEPTTL